MTDTKPQPGTAHALGCPFWEEVRAVSTEAHRLAALRGTHNG